MGSCFKTCFTPISHSWMSAKEPDFLFQLSPPTTHHHHRPPSCSWGTAAVIVKEGRFQQLTVQEERPGPYPTRSRLTSSWKQHTTRAAGADAHFLSHPNFYHILQNPIAAAIPNKVLDYAKCRIMHYAKCDSVMVLTYKSVKVRKCERAKV